MSSRNSEKTINLGHEKSSHVDNIYPFNPQLQNSEEIECQSLSSEAVCSTGITGFGTVDMPLKVLSNCPSFRLGDMPLLGIDWMTDASHLDSYHTSMVDPHLMNRIEYTPSEYSTPENIAASTGRLQMGMQGAKMDDSKLELIGNFMSSRSRAHLLFDAQDGKEMGSNNNLVVGVARSDYPEALDGSFLSLGIGNDTEARSKSSASSRDFISKIDGAIDTLLNPSYGQSGYGSFCSPDFRMMAGLSDFQTYGGGFSSIEEKAVELSSLKHNIGVPNIMQNAGESPNVNASTGSIHNENGCTLSEYDLGVASSTSSNYSLSPLQLQPMPHCHVARPLAPGDHKFGAGFANIDPNQGFHGLSGVSLNVEHIRNQSGLPPNQSFPSLSGTSPLVHSSSQSGLPVHEEDRMTPRPSLSSFMTRKYATLASDQIQKCNMGSIPSLHWWTSVASPVLGSTENTGSQCQSDVWQHYPAHQDAAIQTVEDAPLSRRIELQSAASMLNGKRTSPADHLFSCDGSASQVVSSFPSSRNFAIQTANKLSANDGNAAEVVSNVPSSNNIVVQTETYLGHSQNKTPVQASNNLLVPADTSGQMSPFAGGNGPAVNSNLLARPSLKRNAAQPPAATPQVQMKRIRSVKPSVHSSSFYKAQNAPSVAWLPPVVSQAAPSASPAQSISFVPNVTETAHPLLPLARKGPPPPLLSHATPTHPPLVRTIHVPPSARKSPPPYIKWQETELLQLSGHNCLLCKRDLSFTPEGPVFQPAAPPPVAVLSCGHCFHDLCLQRITHKDQTSNPPCIPCVIGES